VADQMRYRVRIDVSITDQYGSGGLRISEDQEVTGGDFLELAGILGQFHAVLENLKREKSDG
jgi:hypothetical protein